MKFPKLHLICSTDELRPAMMCVQVDKEYTFASDAHILVRHRTSEIFKEDFIQSLPDTPILIPGRCFKFVCQKATTKVSLSDDKNHFHIHRADGSIISYRLVNENYVNASSVIPDPKDCQPLKEIGINSLLLNRLSEGLGCDIPILKLMFFNQRKATYVTSTQTDYILAVGVIMPCNIDPNW